MASKSLMSAVVRVRPDLTEFRKEMQTEVAAASGKAKQRIEEDLTKAGREGGQALGDGLGDGVKHGTKIAKAEISTLEAHAQRLGDGFSKMQGMGMKMSLAITAPLVLMGKKSLSSFSEFQDASAAATVFYGDQVSAIANFADTSASAFGMSKKAAFELANGLAPLIGLFTSADVKGEKAAEAMGRTADMASFFGGSIDEAALAMQSFLSGSSTEPIRRYGVFASEAAVQAKALSMGLIKANVSSVDLAASQTALGRAQEKVVKLARDGKVGSLEYTAALDGVALAEQRIEKLLEGKAPQLTDAMKIQARYAIVMEQTDQAAGDFMRTSDSLANSTKASKAEFENASIAIGEKLAPKMIIMQEHMLKLLDKFTSLPEGTQEFIIMAAAVGAIAGPVLTIVGTIGNLGVAIYGLVAKWLGVAAAADTAAIAQTRATVAGGGAAAGAGGFGIGSALVAATVGLYGGAKGGQALYDNNKGYQNFIDGVVNTPYIGDGLANIGGLITKLPGLANGGDITKSGQVIVGERGPEMLSLPSGARVTPLKDTSGISVTNYVTITGKAADDPAALAKELDRMSRRTAATVSKRRIV